MPGAVAFRVGEGDEVDDVGAIAEELQGAVFFGCGLHDERRGGGLAHLVLTARPSRGRAKAKCRRG